MAKVKTRIEPGKKKKSSPAIDQRQPEREKKAGPAPLERAQGQDLPPPNGQPAAQRAAGVASAEPGAPGRARMATAMQRTMGNARMGRMMEQDRTEVAPQPEPKPPEPTRGKPQFV